MKAKDDTQGLQHLVWEVAYEHWHRMLFARFLAENGLLMWELGAPVSLDDCREMVDNHPDMAMGAKSYWELAGKLAARMLPQVFQASDSLGWVYQFWQAKRKQNINDSEVKIGADELPAVTQLFPSPTWWTSCYTTRWAPGGTHETVSATPASPALCRCLTCDCFPMARPPPASLKAGLTQWPN